MRPDGHYDVAVVGLGPVGSLLALLLARHGLSVLAVDRAAEPYPLPRAVATDDEVLRILRLLPGGREIVEAMLLDCVVEFSGADGRPITALRFPGSGPELPGLATFHQPTLERQLQQRLAQCPTVEIRRGVEVRTVHTAQAAVTMTTDDGSVATATFLVGCDGATSSVRSAVGIRLRGRRSRERWLVIDATEPGPSASPAVVRFSCRTDRPAVSMPMPGGRRWEFLLRPHEVATATTPERVRTLLAEAEMDTAGLTVARSAVYAYSARLADRWRVGRVLLAGDSAHQMPPFAGQGLSAGLRDAAALAWRLELVVRGAAGDRLLDTYQQERQPHVRAMTRLALFTGSVVQTRHLPLARARDSVLRAVDRAPGLGSWLRNGGPRPAARLPRRGRVRRGRTAGRLLPPAVVRCPGGQTAALDELLGPGHALLAADDPFAALPPDLRASWRRLGGCRVRVLPLLEIPVRADPDPDPEVEVVYTDDPRLLRLVRRSRVLLIRPDRYVVAAVPPDRLKDVMARYLAWLQREPTTRRTAAGRGR